MIQEAPLLFQILRSLYLIDSEDICVLLEGFDVSFDRKFVKKIYGDESSEFEFEFKGEKIFGLGYNV